LAVALDEIASTYSGTLFAPGAALDTRDAETEGHSRRVVVGAVALGRAYGLDAAQLVALERGAQPHDVGKIGVPDAILRKPGPLDTEEWLLMRKHSNLGADMLKNIQFLNGAMPVVRHHHEHYNGADYPDKLAGAAIPLHARIFTLVDAWDAMTSNRAYRRALTSDVALTEIQNGAGSQFDPEIVAVFERLVTRQLSVPWSLTSVPPAPLHQAVDGARTHRA